MYANLDHDTASDAEIIAYCSNPSSEADVVPFGAYSNKVKRMSECVVVKHGPGVKIEEFTNLQTAYQLLDSSIVRVPQPHRFFQDGKSGYLIMQYIKGNVQEVLTDPSHIATIGRALSHFTSFQSSQPGPLRGGVSRGLLWGEGTTPEYPLDGSVERLEHWFNRRIEHQDLSLSFRERDLVLCHLDISPRNMIWLQDGSLCIVDWASAGFYPRIFEWCLLHICDGKDGQLQESLRKTMEPLDTWEEQNWRLIVAAWGNSVRYHYPRTPPPT